MDIRKRNIYVRKIAELYIGMIFIMLFLFTGTWIYRTPMMWVLIALSIRFLFEYKPSNKIQYTNTPSNS